MGIWVRLCCYQWLLSWGGYLIYNEFICFILDTKSTQLCENLVHFYRICIENIVNKSDIRAKCGVIIYADTYVNSSVYLQL